MERTVTSTDVVDPKAPGLPRLTSGDNAMECPLVMLEIIEPALIEPWIGPNT